MNNIACREITVLAERDNLDQVLQFIKQELENHNVLITHDIQLAVEEIFINIACYAYETKNGSVTIQNVIERDPAIIHISFIDRGKPFDPRNAKKPNISLPITGRDIGGLGIFLVEQIVDSVAYHYADQKNILTISKYLS